MWGHFKDRVLMACDEKRGRKSKGDTWWWNEEVRETISKRKMMHPRRCVRILLKRLVQV